MYRFLLTPRWLAAAALTVTASVVMVFLGNWQLHRYQERSAINARIDAAEAGTPSPLESVLTRPGGAGKAGPAPGENLAWTKVTVTGRYDPSHEIQARGRTVDGQVGFEILTPLVLADGTAVLIDRGWVPPAEGGAVAAPVAPAAPTGTVTVVGQVHRSESKPAPINRRDGRLDTRRVSLPRLAAEMPYPLYGAYLLASDPEPGYLRIPIDHEDAWQNGGYAVQWWLFALMALVAFGWQARKEAHGDSPRPSRDRVADADRAASDPSASDSSAAGPSGAGPSAAGGSSDAVVPSARRPT